MKKIFLLFTIALLTNNAFSQTYTALQASDHVGDSIKVCGKIFGGRFFETSNGCPTLLNMGAAFPASPLTIMVPLEVRTKLGFAPEQFYKDKNICVVGKVVLFKNKPEIVLYSSSQITVE